MRRDGVSRVRAVVTLVATLGVILGEYLLLTGVYHLGDGLDRQREAERLVAGALVNLNPASETDDASAVHVAVARLLDSGVAHDAGSPARALATAERAYQADPVDPSRITALRVADAALHRDLVAETRRRNRFASLVYATLLVVVSLGWFVWFRGVVRRHRALERRLAEREAVDASERRMLALVHSSADLIVVLETDGTASFVSPSARQVLGREPHELVGERVDRLLHDDDTSVLVEMLASNRSGDHQVRLRLDHADGRLLVADGTLSNLLHEPSVAGWVLTLRDVTEQHALHEELAHQAFHDSLTGLANRQLFGNRLEHALRRRAGSTHTAVVLFCDLDDFKNVNDTYGHTAGDQLLVTVGERLRGAIREGDTAARLGGDEFAVLMEDADLVGAHEVAQRIQDTLGQPVLVDGTEWVVRASIGMAEAITGLTTGEEALRNADVAMYVAKERGKSRIATYDAALHAASLDRMALRTELAVAVREGQLVLHYQPTVDLASGTVSGFEALVRWQHPERGLLPPLEFVPVAEQSGLIVPLGSWVLREACLAAASMQALGSTPAMSVNVSPQQLVRAGFVDEVNEVLQSTGLPPDRLVLEVTETALLDDLAAATVTLTTLRRLGIKIAIDDFGTGYSSLSYLSSLPVDILKVDKAFIDKVTTEEHARSVTLAILDMSHTMRLQTVAEGVETPEQAQWLTEMECGRAQGYLWSRPVPLEEARAMLVTAAATSDEDPTPLAV